MACLLASACTPSGGSLATDAAGNPIAPSIPGIMADVASQSAPMPGAANRANPTPKSGSIQAAGDQPAGASVAPVPAAPTSRTMSPQMTASAADAALPEQVGYVPAPNPADTAAAMPQTASASATSSPVQTSADQTADDTAVQAIRETVPAPIPLPRPAIAADNHVPEDASAMTAFATPAKPAQPKKRGLFAVLFGGASTAKQTQPHPVPPSPAMEASSSSPAIGVPAAPQTADVPVPSAPPVTQAYVMEEGVKPLIDEDAPAKPIVQLVSAETSVPSLAQAGPAHPVSGNSDALPGVRDSTALFEITRKSGTGDDSDVDISEDDNAPVRVASAAGLARLDPHGFLLQRQTVDTACLKPGLIAVLKKVEQHFGHKLIITSGYRSPVHNAAAHGATNSLHMFCAAADVQIPGVSKWQLARYARSLPGRGGVGTYCYTNSVHIDIGPERDWNWRCRRHRKH